MDTAIAIGNNAEKARRRKLTEPQRRKLRLQEISRKVDVLKGRADARYRRQRDRAQEKDTKPEQEQASEGSEREPEEEQRSEGPTAEEEGGEAPSPWAFQRSGGRQQRRESGFGTVSEEARAVTVAELEGSGGAASARQLLDAAEELGWARDFMRAAQLLELARPRIDREQLQRKINALEAQALDDRCLWQLGGAYEKLNRLTLAVETYGTLKDRLLVKKDRLEAERCWAGVAFKLAEQLYNVRRFDECLEVLNLVLETTNKTTSGDKLVEEVQMYAAMALQSLGRVAEAKEILVEVQRNSYSRKRKAQASFVLDVFSVEVTKERNEEFHKMWDANFRLPKDSVGAQVRMGSGAGLNLTPREREWRDWASKYWEERMKSPVYYLFLTLWVTWPFAIPLIAILKKSEIMEDLF